MATEGSTRNTFPPRLDPQRIETEQFVLRLPRDDDAERLAALANHHEIARNLGLVPPTRARRQALRAAA